MAVSFRTVSWITGRIPGRVPGCESRGILEQSEGYGVGVRFSVVIPCFNEADYIGATIASLQAQRVVGGCEIIVVDNNCTDATAAIARNLGATVVTEHERGVCAARQRGAQASRGQIIVSADADTTYAPDWLEKIHRAFAADNRVVGVVGPCRYKDGPHWGRLYARLLFGLVGLAYRLTGRVFYVTATNIAVRRDHFPGYDTRLTQGGDELDLLRRLRRQGRVVYDPGNPSHSSGRRLTRGLVYNMFVTLLVHYLLAYLLNRLFGRRVLGSAPAFRTSRAATRHWRTIGSVAAAALLAIPFAAPAGRVSDTYHWFLRHIRAGQDGHR